MAKELTDANFTAETTEGLVLIDFWAEWCGPCRMQGPIIDQLAAAYDEEQVTITKMDVDANQETPAKFGVMSIPTIILLKDGRLVDQAVGVQTKEQLEVMIAPHL